MKSFEIKELFTNYMYKKRYKIEYINEKKKKLICNKRYWYFSKNQIKHKLKFIEK